jgi:glutathione peroxidase
MSVPQTAYDFAFDDLAGAPLPLTKFRGQALLVVNTASACGYTPQYEALERLWRARRAQGLVVLGVPSNDFGAQEPGSAVEIARFCADRFDVTFPLTAKTVVKGERAHPFYRWVAGQVGLLGRPHWNFHKYLFDRAGHLVDWFSTRTPPDAAKVTKAIDLALGEGWSAAT